MTIEEKVVQRIKDDSLALLIGDEDAIRTLAERAIEEAFFQPERVGDLSRPWEIKEKDSPCIHAAREAAKGIAEQVTQEIMNNPKLKARIAKMVIELLPATIIESIQYGFKNNIQMEAENSIASLKSDLASHLGVANMG